MAINYEPTGIYTAPQAARLLDVGSATVRRWAFGYEQRGKRHNAIIKTQLPSIDGVHALTFIELVELMFIKGALKSGASWRLVHEARTTLARIFRTDHPFALRRCFADPGGVYALLGDQGNAVLVELRGDGQIAMQQALHMYLEQLDFNVDEVAERWFPRGKGSAVVVDPKRAFGAPTIVGTGIQTITLAALFDGTSNVEELAWWYQLEPWQVIEALRFEGNKNAA